MAGVTARQTDDGRQSDLHKKINHYLREQIDHELETVGYVRPDLVVASAVRHFEKEDGVQLLWWRMTAPNEFRLKIENMMSRSRRSVQGASESNGTSGMRDEEGEKEDGEYTYVLYFERRYFPLGRAGKIELLKSADERRSHNVTSLARERFERTLASMLNDDEVVDDRLTVAEREHLFQEIHSITQKEHETWAYSTVRDLTPTLATGPRSRSRKESLAASPSTRN